MGDSNQAPLFEGGREALLSRGVSYYDPFAVNPADGETDYEYDKENRLVEVTLPSGVVVEFYYDDADDFSYRGFEDYLKNDLGFDTKAGDMVHTSHDRSPCDYSWWTILDRRYGPCVTEPCIASRWSESREAWMVGDLEGLDED